MAQLENKKLNLFLADLAVLNVKVHTIHWNVIGATFKDVHELTDDFYHVLQNQYDEFAELMKAHRIFPMGALAEYVDATNIAEIEGRDYPVYEALEILETDLVKLVATAKDVREEMLKTDTFQFSNILEEYVVIYEKYLWFVRAMRNENNA